MAALRHAGALLVFALAIWLTAGTARAATEYCPATLAGPLTRIDGSHYRVTLGGASPRTVSGFLRVQTDAGWYSVPFAKVPLALQTAQYNEQGYSFSHSDYVSGDLVVTFPKDVNVQYAFVRQATSQGDAVFGWDKKGQVTCLPTPVSKNVRQQAPPPARPLDPNAVKLTAAAIDAPFEGTCATPSADIVLLKGGPFRMPAAYGHDSFTAMPEGTTGVIIAVDTDGSVDDAWLWETSGTPMLDNAVLESAKASSFTPGRAFCENVPGFYLLQIHFKP